MTSPIATLAPALIDLLREQQGVATLGQLVTNGLTRGHVRAQVAAKRWQFIGDRCVVTHNFEPTWDQKLWASVLDPVGPVALAGVTSLQTANFSFFGRETTQLHLIVPRGDKTWRLPEVRLHESRRFGPKDIDPLSRIPRTTLPRSALDASAWQPYARYAYALLAAVVQQGISTADELDLEMPRVGRIRHKRHLRLAIADIKGGSEALSEIDLMALCRTFNLEPPARQVVRHDPSGRKRYLDAEWQLPTGDIVVLEVDGGHHMLVEHWGADVKRERKVVIGGRRVLRATAVEMRLDRDEIAADLRAIGVPTL